MQESAPLRNLLHHTPKGARQILARSAMIILAFGIICSPQVQAGQSADRSKNDEKKNLDDVRGKITASTERARKLEDEANNLEIEINKLRQELVAAAQSIQSTESDVYDKGVNLKQLDLQENSLKTTLKSRYGQMSKTLAAMERLSQHPAELVTFRPDKMINSLRSASLLKTLQPELKKRAEMIQKDMTELQDLRQDIIKEQTDLKDLLAALTSEQIEMNNLLTKRHEQQAALREATKEERQKLKKFAATALSLQDLIAKIEAERLEREKAAEAAAQRLAQKPDNATAHSKKSALLNLNSLPNGVTSFRKAKGTMPLPAQGAIQRLFGSKTPEGLTSEGITIHTLPQAMVVAPHEGRIVFAGKFRTYGQLLIIAHGPEYHTLLAGMTSLDAEVGQWVLKGEPVGQMADGPVTASNGKTITGQSLYVELRQMGKPINPLPWIVARERKVL